MPGRLCRVLLVCCLLPATEAAAGRWVGELRRPTLVSTGDADGGATVLEPVSPAGEPAPALFPPRRYSIQEGIGPAAGFSLAGATVVGASAWALLWAQGMPDASRVGAPIILSAALLGAWLVGPLGTCLALGIPPLRGGVWLAALAGAVGGILSLVVPPLGVVAVFLGPSLGVLWAAENFPAAFQPDPPPALAFRF